MDALGNPTGFHLTGGQAPDLAGAAAPLPAGAAPTLIAATGDAAEARVLARPRAAGTEAVLPPERNRQERRAYDADPYAARHPSAHCFGTRKQVRASATRYAKTRRNCLAAVSVAAAVILLN